jgi:hypothetical protein
MSGKNPGAGSLATAVGVTGMWTLDRGATATLNVGFGLQERGRNSKGHFEESRFRDNEMHSCVKSELFLIWSVGFLA